MILLTAFEPFGTDENNMPRNINVSKQTLLSLRREFGNAMSYLVMSVGPECVEQFDEAVGGKEWDAIILMGEAPGDGPIRIEKYATDPADPAALRKRESALANETLAEKCGLALTDEIGRYFCNVIYYHALGFTDKAIFVHLPRERNHGEHKAALQKIIQTLRGLI